MDLPAPDGLDAPEALDGPDAGPAPDTQGDDSRPAALTEGPERPALPPRAPRPALPAPPDGDAAGASRAGQAAGNEAGDGPSAGVEVFEGAKIYVLDSSRRSGR